MPKIKNIMITCCLFAISAAHAGKVITADQQQSMSPKAALQKLVDGNARYLNDQLHPKDKKIILEKNAKGQHPFAFIFNCVDSRSVPDYLFDQAPGNIFVGRIAGNVADPNVLGSMEFATKVAGSKLILIMGHTACGAVKGACANVEMGNLTGLLAQIQPAVLKVQSTEKESFNCKSDQTINSIAKQNVIDQMNYVIEHSEVIDDLVKENKVMLVGAMHDLATGKVNFFNLDGQPLN